LRALFGGPAFVDMAANAGADRHFRYLSGLMIGALAWNW
jgi:hypothetical protein